MRVGFFTILCLPVFVILSSPDAAEKGRGSKKGVPAKRTNILLVMSDDQGWGDVGYNGHPVLRTPNLDAAAASGLRLDRFYAAAPSCSPTRASVLTGRHPNRMGVFSWGHPIRPQEITLAEVLRGAGYATGHFGKWHLGQVRADSPVSPGANGFERWISAENFYDFNPEMSDQGKPVRLEGEGNAVTVDLALQWIRERAAGEAPFFATVWFGSPHFPHKALAEDAALYPGESRKEREYLGEITALDRAFGRIRAALAELDLRDNTLVWFCSDNGAMPVGEVGDARGGKHVLYEGGLRVPAFIEWPAVIPQPVVSPVRCVTSDIFPTVLEIAGVPAPGRVLDGMSLVPLIRGEMQVRPSGLGFWNAGIPGHFTNPAGVMDKLLPTIENWSDNKVERVTRRVEKIPKLGFPAEVYSGHSAWISGDWKLHRVSATDGGMVRWSLYNLANDPREQEDLSKEYPEVVSELGAQLEKWLSGVVASLRGADY
jgi:arylsulfatase A-like enzyme